jgi:hypothetical protein
MTAEEIAFIEEQIEEARQLAILPKEGQIAALCEAAGCSTTIKRSHEQAYTRHGWNPHPSERFKRWWMGQGYVATEKATGDAWSTTAEDGKHWPVNYITAYNCEAVREVWRDFLDGQREELRRLKGGGTDEIPF